MCGPRFRLAVLDSQLTCGTKCLLTCILECDNYAIFTIKAVWTWVKHVLGKHYFGLTMTVTSYSWLIWLMRPVQIPYLYAYIIFTIIQAFLLINNDTISWKQVLHELKQQPLIGAANCFESTHLLRIRNLFLENKFELTMISSEMQSILQTWHFRFLEHDTNDCLRISLYFDNQKEWTCM